MLCPSWSHVYRVAVIHAELNPSKATQLPLALVHAALEMQGMPKDNGEADVAV